MRGAHSQQPLGVSPPLESLGSNWKSLPALGLDTVQSLQESGGLKLYQSKKKTFLIRKTKSLGIYIPASFLNTSVFVIIQNNNNNKKPTNLSLSPYVFFF